MVCENNDFTPCLKAFSSFESFCGGKKEKIERKVCTPCSLPLHDGALYDHGKPLHMHLLGKSKLTRSLVHTFGHISGTLSV